MATENMATALAAAQAKIKVAVKESENEAFKRGGKVSKYADLSAVWEACRGPLSESGLSITQTTDFDEKDVWLVTTLRHTSGEQISGRYPLRPVKNDPQGFGSALTYARRYTIAAMVGVVADEDDDGNRASLNGNGHVQANGNGNPYVSTGGKITAAQVQTLRDKLTEVGRTAERFCAYFKIEAIPDLPSSEYQRALETMVTRKNGNANR